VQKISFPPGFDPQTIQSVLSLYADCATPAHSIIWQDILDITLDLLCHEQMRIPVKTSWITACHQDSWLNLLKDPYFSLSEVSQYLDGCLPHQLRHHLDLKHANISVNFHFFTMHFYVSQVKSPTKCTVCDKITFIHLFTYYTRNTVGSTRATQWELNTEFHSSHSPPIYFTWLGNHLLTTAQLGYLAECHGMNCESWWCLRYSCYVL
jgi:hypothetical protein